MLRILSLTIFCFAIFCGWRIADHAPKLLRLENTHPGFVNRSGILFFNAQPFTGIQIENYLPGHPFRELHYFLGRLEGKSYEYSVDHRLTALWNFRNGLKHGAQYGWYSEGPKRFKREFKDGILDGESVEYHQNGVVFRRLFFVDGVERDRKILFSNRDIYSNYTKRDGRIYGIDSGPLCMETKAEGER